MYNVIHILFTVTVNTMSKNNSVGPSSSPFALLHIMSLPRQTVLHSSKTHHKSHTHAYMHVSTFYITLNSSTKYKTKPSMCVYALRNARQGLTKESASLSFHCHSVCSVAAEKGKCLLANPGQIQKSESRRESRSGFRTGAGLPAHL
jgi:hypothetical protein